MARGTDLLDPITVRPGVFGGKPIIRDMRIAVEHVLANLAAEGTVEDILGDYPFLEPEASRHAFSSLTAHWRGNMCMTASPCERLRDFETTPEQDWVSTYA